MHQTHQRIALMQPPSFLRHHAEGEAIDHDRTGFRGCEKPGQRKLARRAVRIRERATEVDHLDLPAKRAQFRDDAFVIGEAAGRRVEAPWHRERRALHESCASYQARATCDSERVTRIAFSSLALRPNLPPRAAAASRSKMCLVRNSVVVLRPLNSGTSSRLR